MAGRTLSDGRYELDSPLARGGMGEVWLGRDVKLDREIAVKFIRLPGGAAPEPEHVRRFVRESRITARLQHPGVPAVYDGGTDENGWPFLVMQRVHGVSVDHLVGEHGPLPVGWVAAVAAQVCAVLTAAHAASLVHRDLKPSNLILEPDGCVKVLDFGLAVAPTLAEFSRITLTNQPLGSPPYMAPEQVEANLSEPATDLYALGCTMYEMLTAEHVFTGPSLISVMFKQVKDPPPPLRSVRPDVPESLERLVLDMLEKKPEDRPASAEVVYRRLLPFVADLSALPSVVSPQASVSPARLYAGVLDRLSTRTAAPERPVEPTLAKAETSSSAPRVSRQELAKARDEARRLVRQSRFRQAAEALEEVARLAQSAFGDADQDVLQVRYELATTLFEGGDYRRAGPVYHGIAATLSKVAAPSDLLFDCRLKEATCHALTGRISDALRELGGLLAAQRAAHLDDEPRTLELRKQIGLLQLGSGQRQAAEQTLTSLLADLRRLPPEGRPDVESIAGIVQSIGGDTESRSGIAEGWHEVLRYADRDEPALDALIQDLATRGLTAPVVGFELGDEGWPAELAWPDQRIAVLTDEPADDPETVKRDAAYAAAGWDARTAARWNHDELAERIN